MFPCCNKYKIKFSKYVLIILIPTKEEYNELKDKLWWDNNLLSLFKESAIQDIRRLLSIHSSMTIKDAMRLLYQPPNVNLQYDKNNFYD